MLSTVYQLVQHGWPKERRRVPNVAKFYWDFRDKLLTDEGLLLKGLSLVLPAVLRESYLQHLHKGHLSVISNTKQHMFWPGMEADIKDYTRRCQVCVKRSRPAREPLQSHEIPEGHGRRYAWISLTSKASVTFLSVIISQSFLICSVAKLVGVH